MKKTEKEFFKVCGYLEEDFNQIDKAKKAVVLILCDEKGRERRITAKQARELLDEKQFLSGLGRSTFHWTAARTVTLNPDILDSGITVFFDCGGMYMNRPVERIKKEIPDEKLKDLILLKHLYNEYEEENAEWINLEKENPESMEIEDMLRDLDRLNAQIKNIEAKYFIKEEAA